jgi:hypothetical protein
MEHGQVTEGLLFPGQFAFVPRVLYFQRRLFEVEENLKFVPRPPWFQLHDEGRDFGDHAKVF